jgi:hypothetical protein
MFYNLIIEIISQRYHILLVKASCSRGGGNKACEYWDVGIILVILESAYYSQSGQREGV